MGDLQEDYRYAKRTFLATSTLKDSFDLLPLERVKQYFKDEPLAESRDTVEALFRLGQYLVYLNSCALRDGLRLPRGDCPENTWNAPLYL